MLVNGPQGACPIRTGDQAMAAAQPVAAGSGVPSEGPVRSSR